MIVKSDANALIEPLQVFSLVCRRDIKTSIPALTSITRHLKDPHTLTLLSDGSLSPENEREFAAKLPLARLIGRSELDSLVTPMLNAYQRCKKFRARWPWALKLIDLQVLAAGNFGFIDSDVLMVRNFNGFDAATEHYDIVHMRSYANIYCVSLTERARLAKHWPCVDRFNSGFMFVRHGRMNLDLIEEALAALGVTAEMPLAEQTVWAMAAARMHGVGFFDARQIAFPQTLPVKPLAVHYIGGTRALLEIAALKERCSHSEEPPEKLRIYPSENGNLMSGVLDVVRHSWILHRWKRYRTNWVPG